MGTNPGIKLVDESGKRIDGRGLYDLRNIKMDVGVLKKADGSAYLEWGGNKVIAAVYGPRPVMPKHLANPYKAVLLYRYNMAPFSVDDRKRPGPDRRSIEISKVSREALERIIMTEYFPNTMIEVFVEILQADAGTRCAALTAASLALADAGIPMRDLVAACAGGKIDGKIALDLKKEEDNYGEADMPIAISGRTGEVLLFQMDGLLTKEEFLKTLRLVHDGAKKVYEIEKETLKNKYKVENLNEGGKDELSG